MRVDGRSIIQPNATPSANKAGAAGQGFSLPSAAKPEQTQKSGPARAAHSAIPLDTLIAVQAREDDTERRKRHAKRGREMIDGLDRLKAALLSGRVPLGELERLKAMLAERRRPAAIRALTRSSTRSSCAWLWSLPSWAGEQA